MGFLGIFLLVVSAALEVRVQPTVGEAYDAVLEGVSGETVQLLRNGTQLSVSVSELASIERRSDVEVIPPTISVGLIDGSLLRCDALSLSEDTLTLSLRGQEKFQTSIKETLWIRFRRPSAEVDEAWLGLLGKRRSDDLLVIRRSNDAIDQVPGIIKSIDDAKVAFARGAASVDAPISRLEGLVLGGIGDVRDRTVSLVDTNGSIWAVSKFVKSTDVGSVRVLLGSETERSFELSQLQEIRFAETSLMLASEEPVVRTFEPLVQVNVDRGLLDKWMGPRVDGGTDLVLRSRSTLGYRIDPQYRSFSTILVPDPKVIQGTGASVQVLLDETIVWEGTVVPGDKPLGLQFDLNSARRITFKVDYGEDDSVGDSGDVVRFVGPRLLQ